MRKVSFSIASLKKLLPFSNYNKKIMVLFEEKVGDYWEGYTKNYIRVKVKTEENLENKLQEVVPIKEEKQILIYRVGRHKPYKNGFFAVEALPLFLPNKNFK